MDPNPSKSPTLFPIESCPQISDEEFNLFHSIDRELYTRLINNLGRDPNESIQVIAFWIWLERERNDSSLITRLLSLPLMLVNEVADETVTCLRCVESDLYRFGENEISLLPDLVNNRVVSLRFFHENRIAVIRGVMRIISTVCARAFNDILQRPSRVNNNAYTYPPPAPGLSSTTAGGTSGGRNRRGFPPVQFVGITHEVGESSRDAERRLGTEDAGCVPPQPPVVPVLLYQQNNNNPYNLNVPFVPVPKANVPLPPPPPTVPVGHQYNPVLVGDHVVGIPIQMLQTAARTLAPYDFAAQRQMLSNTELGEMLSRCLSINGPVEEGFNNVQEEEVPADDRTIFLTFSKGYPITEDEVREYFTRRFGNFIEELIMQEVGDDEQPLYARMVVQRGAVNQIAEIVGGNYRHKYSINGKHVWARKYIVKRQQSS